MELTRVIVGSVVTEKSELEKQGRTYVLRIAPEATKVDVKNALRMYFGVDVSSVRVLRVGPKTRNVGTGTITKRKRFKKVFVTLTEASKALDLAQFKAA